jgi:hypothetical protein
MPDNYVQIIEDIEEALSREVRRIIFTDESHKRSVDSSLFKECYDPFTGKQVRKPVEARYFDNTADGLGSTSPRFDIRLLKLYEDRDTKRMLPPYGEEFIQALPAPLAYSPVIAGKDAKTTNGGTGNTVTLTHRKIREVQVGEYIRLLCSDNDGTYRIESITLNGNGPHTLLLSHDLLIDIPAIHYNKDAGLITFDPFLDIKVVKSGDIFRDANGAIFTILATDMTNSTITIAPGSAITLTLGSKIYRVGDVLQQDDSGRDIKYVILDPTQIISNKSTQYRVRNQVIPYTFLYYIKITSRERDDHITSADRMMQIFNPPRGSLTVLARSKTSTESKLIKDAGVGDTILYIENSERFYVNDIVRVYDNFGLGEEVKVTSVNITSNSITIDTALTQNYTVNNFGNILSNYELCTFERDFTNHITEDREDMMLWIHRFTFRIEAWVEARIDTSAETELGEPTHEDIGDINFIEFALEDTEGNPYDDPLIP